LSSIRQALGFARLAEVRRLVLFHHNPTHTDADLDRLIEDTVAGSSPPFPVLGGMESATFDVGSR
jgi:phosphoribosyl 1,2-cyclic phosphodiesterase